ncbi:pseudouridine synthase [Kurthia senegalensis]|uniref:pseudouridine synthase n=1 Tax=Kurthia senegalensis TaxID=1033740 RepID=UPI0002894974|nr:pseudouridine synthase [Kurthia senegalensis]
MERLQKVIAHAGIASRRKAEQLILDGQVKVNGEIVRELGTKVSPTDRVEVDNVKIEQEDKVYFLLYKPRNTISAVTDDRGRDTVTDLFPNVHERIFPVGRLDFDTTGVLLLTNDGEFSNVLTHPKYNVEKTYVATLQGVLKREEMRKLERGVMLEDGKTAPARVRIISSDDRKGKTIVAITIHEGKNRQVRRMFEAVGHRVSKLKREQFGFLTTMGLNAGEWRELTPHEVKQLRALAQTGKIG